jgi:hypothetical protein
MTRFDREVALGDVPRRDADPGVRLWNDASEGYKPFSAEETTLLAMPWAPRIDVYLGPLTDPNIAGGTVKICARMSGLEIAIATAQIVPGQPLRITASAGCPSYAIRAQLTWVNPAAAQPVQGYVYARVFHGGG